MPLLEVLECCNKKPWFLLYIIMSPLTQAFTPQRFLYEVSYYYQDL